MKREVMITAWEIAREAVVEFGGKVVEYLSGALKMAWAKIKGENKMEKDYSKDYAYQLDTENTKDIDYREYMTDYSEKAYKFEYKEYAEDEGIRTVYVPKSLVTDQGQLPLWFVRKQDSKFPSHSYFSNLEDNLFQLEKKIIRLKDTASEAKNPEKRARNIKRQEAKVNPLKQEIRAEIESQIERIVK